MIELNEDFIKDIYDKAITSQAINSMEYKIDDFTICISDKDEDDDVKIFNIYILFEGHEQQFTEHLSTPSDIIGIDKKRTGYEYFKEKLNNRVNELLDYGKDVVKWKRMYL